MRNHYLDVLPLNCHIFISGDYKGDREGIPNIHPIPYVIRLELFLESGKSYSARGVDVSWRFRMTKRRAKHVGREAMKA